MELIYERADPANGWISRLVEVLKPLSLRADRLGSMDLFYGLRWSELEFAAGLLEPVEVPRGTRMTVQGRPGSTLWLISEGEALVSADARPLRVAGHGDPVGVTTMLYGIQSHETTIALSPIQALAADQAQFKALIARREIRRRLTAAAADQLRVRRRAFTG